MTANNLSIIAATVTPQGDARIGGANPPSLAPLGTITTDLATVTSDLALAAANPTISGNATALATVTQVQTDVAALSVALTAGSAALTTGADVILGVNMANSKLTGSAVRDFAIAAAGMLGLKS